MATKYPVIAGGNWATDGTWTLNSDGTANATVAPTATDDVIFNATSGAVTINSNVVCKTFSASAGTLNHTTGSWRPSGNLDLTNLTYNGPGEISFRATGNFTSAGKSILNLDVTGTSATVTILDSTTVTNLVQLTSGTLKTDGATDNAGLSHSWGKFSSSNSNTRTLTLGASAITITGAAISWTTATASNMTLNRGTSLITFTSAGYQDFYMGGLTYYDVTFTVGTGSDIVPATGTIRNLTVTGAVSKTSYLNFYSNLTVTGTFTIAGNSSVNRILIRSSTLGTARTITNSGATMTWSNVDFRDITLGTAYDASAITGLSGDCGGNSGITFTTGATQTATMSTSKSWSDATIWTSRVPLPQDDVSMASVTGGTLTADMPRLGKSIDWTGASGTPTYGQSLAVTVYGSYTLISSMNHTNSFGLTFEGRGTHTITSAGKTFSTPETVQSIGGSYSLQDAYVSTGTLAVYNGSFISNGFSLTLPGQLDTNRSTTRGVDISGSTLTFTGTGTTLNAPTLTGLTWNASGSTIVLSNTSASSKTFASGGLTFNNLSITGGGTGAVIISGSNTFNTVTIGSPKTVTFTSATTQTVSNFVATGTAGNLITLNATTLTTTPPILSTTNGYMNCQYVDVQGVNVTPAGRWFSGNKNAPLGLNFGGQAATGDYVSAANSASGNQIYGATSFSTERWQVSRGLGGNNVGYSLSKADTATVVGGYGTGFFGSAVVRSWIIEGGALKSTTTTTTVTHNALTHIVTTWTSGGAVKIYINGSEASYSGTPTVVTTPTDDSAQVLTIGNFNNRAGTHDGQIFLARIYRNVALSAGDVTTLYNSGVMTKTSNPLGNATAEYLFHEGTGSTLTDSISAVNGTITGADWANTGWRDGSSMDMFRSLY